jgi:hypothetical protein
MSLSEQTAAIYAQLRQVAMTGLREAVRDRLARRSPPVAAAGSQPALPPPNGAAAPVSRTWPSSSAACGPWHAKPHR